MAIRLLSSESISGSLTVSGTLGLSGTTTQYVRGDGAFTTLPLIPSDNVTGTGVAGKVAYWTSANIIDDGPITFSGVNVIFDSRNIIPSIDASLTLGTGALRWNFAYINNALSVTDGNINAGTTFDFNQGANFLGNLNLTNTGSNPKITLVENSGGTQNSVIEFDQSGENQLYITTNYVSPSDSNRILLQPGSYPALTASGGANGAINTKVEISGTLLANRNIQTPNSDLSTGSNPTNFGIYTSEIRLIDTPNGGLKQCRVITDNYGEWILVGRFAASAMTTIQSIWSSESGLDTSTSQSTTTKFSADFGDSYPTEVRIMGATDFTKWRDTRTVDFVYGVPEGRAWKYFFSGGAENGMTSVGPNHSGNNKFGWNINGSYDGFGRWVNPAQTSVGMSDANITNPSAAYTTATNNAFNWESASDAKITVSATRTFSGQDSYETAGFGNDDNIQGFFDEYPGEAFNMNGGIDFSSAVWVLIKLPTAISSGSGGGSGNQWAGGPTTIHNTNTGSVGIGTSNPVVTGKGLEIQNIGNDTTASLKLTGHNNTGTPGAATSTELKHIGDSLKFAINHAGTDALTIGSSASTIGFTLSNTTELGTYPTGAVKRIRMVQGGEIHFGDTTTASPLGVTEGVWDNFGDQDSLGIYSRDHFSVYSYGGTYSNPKLRIDDAGSYFQGSNFGIGVTGPLSPLSIQANSGGSALRLIGRSDGISGIDFFNSTQTVGNYFQSNGTWIRLRADGGFHFSKGSTPITTDVDGFTIEGMNVGIGTTSPEQKLHVEGRGIFDGGGSSDILQIRNDNGGGVFGMTSNLFALDLASTSNFRIRQGSSVPFYLNSSGNVGIGNVSPQTTLHTGPTTTITNAFTARFAASNFFASGGNSMFYVPDTAANIMMFGSNQFGTNQIEFYHKNPGTSQSYVGRISTSGSATSYVTSSDYRLKENIVPISESISRLNQLKPSRFNFIEEPGKVVDGFIAHEVQDIVPEAIVGEKDEVDEEGGIIPQGIDQAKLVPLLVAAVQELEARVKELENK